MSSPSGSQEAERVPHSACAPASSGPVLPDALGGPQFGAVVDVRVGVRGEGVRDEAPAGVVLHRVPGRLGGVARRSVADPGAGAASDGLLEYLPSPEFDAVAGVRDPRAVRGPGRGLLVVRGVAEPAQARAVDADRPQVALDRAAGSGLRRVEDDGPAVRGEFGVSRVPVGGEPAHRAVRAAHVHLRPGAVTQAGEDQDVPAGGGVLVVVGRAVAEQRVGGVLVVGPPQAAVFGAGEGDAPRLERFRVRHGGDGLGGPVRGGGRADQQQRCQQHHRAGQSAQPGMLCRASSAGHGPPHSLSMTLHRPASPPRGGEGQAASTRDGGRDRCPLRRILRSARAASRSPPRGPGCAVRAGSRPRAARS
ncbi:hypothetical protein M2436_005344 [Streptomyces sp. HB372]|nr:hypothetical protein [Streptomyces sp. HB372]